MADKPELDPRYTVTGITMETDADRTPEFKEGRDHLAETIDTFLGKILAMQMAGMAIKGRAISWQPVITETIMGKSGPNADLMVTEAKEGISLVGDGESTRLSLQCVTGDVTIKLQGSDPLERSVNGLVYGAQAVPVASFYREEGRNYYGGSVEGSGAVRQTYFREADGMNVGGAIRDPKELGALQDGLQLVLDEVLPPAVQQQMST